MTAKHVRTQAAVDIAMSRLPSGQPLKAVNPNTLLGCGARDEPSRLRVHSAWREDLRRFVSELRSSQPVA